MAIRKTMSMKKDKKVFKQTANKTHYKNLISYIPRGGKRY